MRKRVTIGLPLEIKERFHEFKFILKADTYGEALTKLMDFYEEHGKG